MADTKTQTESKAKKKRSPAYPGINLAQAIKRAAQFYEKEHKNPASFNAAARHWEYGPKSSGALVTVAALKSFGLVNELDSASGRTIQMSPLGLKIVADKRPDSPERDAAIKEAALKPKIHAEIWRRYNGRVPSDEELAYRLENEMEFNVNSIAGFIQELKDTVKFAKLDESDTISSAQGDNEDNDGGIGQDEAEQEPPELLKRINPPLGARKDGGTATMRQDVFSLTEGQVVLNWPTPLSQASIDDLKDWLKIVERKISRSTDEEKKPTE
jgi:hypothetical protein